MELGAGGMDGKLHQESDEKTQMDGRLLFKDNLTGKLFAISRN